MEGQEYTYKIRPLLFAGGIYLFLYPILVGVLGFIFKVSELEFYLLFGIYGLTAVALVSIWVYGHKKSIRVDQDYLLINSMFGLDRLEPGNIRKIAQFQTHQGQEGVYIKTENKVYYLNDQYFPFPELLTDLERFVAEHGIRTNFSSN